MTMDSELLMLLAGLIGLLTLATVAGRFVVRRKGADRPDMRNLIQRIRAWWGMLLFFGLAVLAGSGMTVLLFAAVSFLALREFITLTRPHRADHRALFWAFFILTPMQYILLYREMYGMFTIFIPVYGFLWMPVRNVLAGETEDFLARTAKVQWALMVAVYFISHAPALLLLDIEGYEGESAKLLLFLVVVVQASDVLQYVWGKTLGRRPVAPTLSPGKTVEGFIWGVASATALGRRCGGSPRSRPGRRRDTRM